MLGIEVNQFVIDYLNLRFRVNHEPIYNIPIARIVLVSGGILAALLFLLVHILIKNQKFKHDWIPMVYSIYQIFNAVAEGFLYQKHEVRQLITNMAKDKCIIVSTHILEEVEAVCSRTIIISKGQILADSTPEDLKSKHRGTLDEVFRKITTSRVA